MTRSATPAARHEATQCVKASKVTPLAELTTGRAIPTPRGGLQTVADRCRHKRKVEQTHHQFPDPQGGTATLATRAEKPSIISAVNLHDSSCLRSQELLKTILEVPHLL